MKGFVLMYNVTGNKALCAKKDFKTHKVVCLVLVVVKVDFGEKRAK